MSVGSWFGREAHQNTHTHASTKQTNPPLHFPLPIPTSHLAASEGCYKVTEWLLSQKASVNAVDRFRRTPLEEAVRGDFSEVAKLLVDHGAKVHEGGKVSSDVCVVCVCAQWGEGGWWWPACGLAEAMLEDRII